MTNGEKLYSVYVVKSVWSLPTDLSLNRLVRIEILVFQLYKQEIQSMIYKCIHNYVS